MTLVYLQPTVAPRYHVPGRAKYTSLQILPYVPISIPGIFDVHTTVRRLRYTKIMLGWKTYEYYYETDKLPNPRPSQPNKN